MFVNWKVIFKFKADKENCNFPTQFCLGSISSEFGVTKSREVSLKWIVNDFFVDFNDIDKSDTLNMHKYLMFKIKIKKCLELLSKCLLGYCILADL